MGDDKRLQPRQHGMNPDAAVPFSLARRQLRQLVGGLRGQVLVSFCGASALMLLLASGANVWLTLRLADATNRQQVSGHLNALLATWQASSSLPQQQRLRLLQRSLDQINDPSNLYLLHLGGGTLLRPPQWRQLPPAYLQALSSGVHGDTPERLVNLQGEAFEIRHYPFLGGDSHAHVAHRLAFVASYTREQLLLVLILLPLGLLASLLIGFLLGRRMFSRFWRWMRIWLPSIPTRWKRWSRIWATRRPNSATMRRWFVSCSPDCARLGIRRNCS